MATRLAHSPHRQKLHISTAEQFDGLATDIQAATQPLDETGPKSGAKHQRLSLTQQEIHGLPDDLLKELSISEGDKTEFALLAILEEAGGMTTLDRLLIGLYKKTGEIIKRPALTSKLYRMSQKDLIYNVPTKKGVYATREISEEEATRIFAND